jgi:hypothetical protein
MTYKAWADIEIGRIIALASNQGRDINGRVDEPKDGLPIIITLRMYLVRGISHSGSLTAWLILIKILHRNGRYISDIALLTLVEPIVQVGVGRALV